MELWLRLVTSFALSLLLIRAVETLGDVSSGFVS